MLYNILFDILKFTVSGILVTLAAFYIAKPYLDDRDKNTENRGRKKHKKQTLALQLQAYERLLIFIDRANPTNLLLRLNQQGLTAGELHYLAVAETKNEFQHNISQQLYVSETAWEVTKRVKNDTIFLLNSALKTALPETSGIEFSKLVFEHLASLENSPYDAAACIINNDAARLF